VFSVGQGRPAFILCNSDFDFILDYNLLLCFIPLEMHVRLICAIKFYLLTYLFLRDFTFNRPCMKLLFKTGSIDEVKDCHGCFATDLPSCVLKRRQDKFIL